MQTFVKKHKAPGPILRKISFPSYCPECILQRVSVRNILRSAGVQAKLTVGAPDDVYEKEADRVAETVMRMPEPEQAASVSGTARLEDEPIQRFCPAGENELQRQPVEEEEEEELLQTKRNGGGAIEATDELGSRIGDLRGGGQPLSEASRSFFEPRLGVDLSQVRVHGGAKANDLTRKVNARAFTLGQDVVFGAGQYSPGTEEGKRLLAHELTHVVQQSELQRKIPE